MVVSNHKLKYPYTGIRRLTWAGHEAVEELRSGGA